jgi:hypothetical protein
MCVIAGARHCEARGGEESLDVGHVVEEIKQSKLKKVVKKSIFR